MVGIWITLLMDQRGLMYKRPLRVPDSHCYTISMRLGSARFSGIEAARSAVDTIMGLLEWYSVCCLLRRTWIHASKHAVRTHQKG